VVDDYTRLPAAPDEDRILAPAAGFVSLESGDIGRAAVALGAGRAVLEDVVDPGVGIEVVAGHGTAVRAGDVVLLVRHRAGRGLAEARALLHVAARIGAAPGVRDALIVERITDD
jgi:thymidine phosphorylase